jgi:membrane-bound lytic murein transglycosylase B
MLLLLSLSAQAVQMVGIPQFVDEMVEKYQFDRDELDAIFQRAEHRPDVIEAIDKPATKKPWPEYRAAFINNLRVSKGLEFWRKHRKALNRAEQQFGVPQEIIVALIGVETLYGQQTGKYRTLDALSTLAFDYPRRADFFRSELAEYLLLAHEQKFNLYEVKASYAGALGIPQFMPSSYRKYAVDFNANGKIDLLNEPEDAIGSVANYLKQYGWKSGELVAQQARLTADAIPIMTDTPRRLDDWATEGVVPMIDSRNSDLPSWLLGFSVGDGKEYWFTYPNFRVITLYNNSNFYAMSVFQLAQILQSKKS